MRELSIILQNLKETRCKIQEHENYQPEIPIFTENTLAVEITMSSVKTQEATFRDKFGVNQHNKCIMQTTIIWFKTEKIVSK